MKKIRYPHIKIDITIFDGNTVLIASRTLSALRKANVPKKERIILTDALFNGDYKNVRSLCRQWVTITEKR